MAGLLRAPAAARLVTALRERFDLPVHLHTHDTAGGQLATLLAAIGAGVDAVDVASASMSGTTSQPSMSALVAATDGTERATGLDLQAVCDLEPYWEGVRQLYAPFESGLASPTGRVYTHEIPGGQLSNLRQQAIALGLGDRFESIEDMYAAANRILGNIVKVTPSSKVVGDLALALVGANADPAQFEADPTRFDIPDSVIGFLNGDLGDPPGGWPEPFRTKALEGRTRKPAVSDLSAAGRGRPRARRRGGPSTGCSSPGRPGTSRPPARPTPTCPSSAPASSCTGWPWAPSTRWTSSPASGCCWACSRSATPTSAACAPSCAPSTASCARSGCATTRCEVDVRQAERADPAVAGQVAAPFAGVISLSVAEGDTVEVGDPVATIEAMKMEAAITSPVAGTVQRLAIGSQQQVEGGDLLLVVG